VRPTGPGARFNRPDRIALGERGRLLVSEDGREDTLRVVESLLAPDEEKRAALAAFQNYGKLVETPELHDVVLVVERPRAPRGAGGAERVFSEAAAVGDAGGERGARRSSWGR